MAGRGASTGGQPGEISARRLADATAMVRLLSPGDRLFMPGSGAEVPALVEALCAPDAPPLDITTTFVPGINRLPLDRLPSGTVVRSPFAHPGATASEGGVRLAQLPMSYGTFLAHLARTEFDVGLVQVSPADQWGQCSFGIAVEFTPMAIRRCRRIFAVINPHMPRLPGAETFDLRRADVFVENAAPLREYDVGPPSAAAGRIAASIAGFVEDGSTLQIGIGKIPNALFAELRDRRGLRLHSGMLSDATRLLVEAGSLDPDVRPTSCVHVGTRAHYDWLADRTDFAVRGCDITHSPAVLASLPRLITVNSALSVDLFGQADLEMLNGRLVSGVGGAADFAHAATVAPDGLSIVALPATSGRGEASRIVTRLDGLASLPRNAIDMVITEHGVADLRGLAVAERGERLISVAAPQWRDVLSETWRKTVARL